MNMCLQVLPFTIPYVEKMCIKPSEEAASIYL